MGTTHPSHKGTRPKLAQMEVDELLERYREAWESLLPIALGWGEEG